MFARVFAPADRGLVNVVLDAAGGQPRSWLLDVALAMPTIAVTKIWWSAGFNMLIFLAGLQDIPQELYEAARVDGANRLVLIGLMVPGQATFIPVYLLFSNLRLLNTFAALILPGIASSFAVFLLVQFFRNIPIELEEAALLDGASRPGVYRRIFLPLSTPVLTTLAIFTFLGTWNEFLWPLVAATDPDIMTITIGLRNLTATVDRGESAGVIDGTWRINVFDGMVAEGEVALANYYVANFPQIFDEPGTFAGSHNWLVPLGMDADPERVAAAAQFIRWLSDNSVVWARVGHGMTRSSVLASEEFLNLPHRSEYAEMSETVRSVPREIWGNAFWGIVHEEVEAALPGVKTPEVALADAQARLEEFVLSQ